MGASRLGDAEQLAGAVAGLFVGKSHVDQQGHGGIDDAGAGRISASGEVFDLTDQVVSVARLLLDQFQQHQPQFSPFENAPALTAASTRCHAATAEKCLPHGFHSSELAAGIAMKMSHM